jgi:FkbM family methyltransferase
MHLNVPKRLIRDGYIRVAGPAWRTDDAEDRFSLFIPVDLLGDPSAQFLLREEHDGAGYEARERRIMDRLLPPKCLFLDIGAHWGIYSLHALTAPVDAFVVAVEPDPINLRHLHYNVVENGSEGRVAVIAAAVAAEAGVSWLRRNTSMGHHLARNSSRAGDNAVEVVTVTIDDLVAQFDSGGHRPIWVKLDIEGREMTALQGAIKTLASGRIAGILWEARAGGRDNPEAETIVELLHGHGLVTWVINEDYRLSIPAGGSAPDLD